MKVHTPLPQSDQVVVESHRTYASPEAEVEAVADAEAAADEDVGARVVVGAEEEEEVTPREAARSEEVEKPAELEGVVAAGADDWLVVVGRTRGEFM
jgi:hypothetical protein